ncbi:beta-glucosidase 16-like [Bidens hawaiensis]|uniref:beta-glucosidase 16-like n=1 Tax=Bidens hawaiensis TaxID=980011 RepID=UPI00404A18F1
MAWFTECHIKIVLILAAQTLLIAQSRVLWKLLESAMTSMARFFVVPRGMEEIVNYMKTRYNNTPMFITENGYSSPNVQDVQVEDIVNDFKRIEFHWKYLAALAEAIRNGANVRGYFVWSLMDNYEWNHGYNVRFGLHYVDRKTFDRIPKLSAKWYQEFLKNNSLVDPSAIRTRKSLLISY